MTLREVIPYGRAFRHRREIEIGVDPGIVDLLDVELLVAGVHLLDHGCHAPLTCRSPSLESISWANSSRPSEPLVHEDGESHLGDVAPMP